MPPGPTPGGASRRVPSIACLEAAQIVSVTGESARGVIVRLSTEGGVVRTSWATRNGESIFLAFVAGGLTFRTKAVVTSLVEGGFAFRFVDFEPETRARLTRFIYGRLRPAPEAPRPVMKELRPPREDIEPSRRKVSFMALRIRDTDRHCDPSDRWLPFGGNRKRRYI